MPDRKSYQDKVEAELNRLSEEIGRLLARAEVKAKTEYKKQSEVLGPKLEAARDKFQELTKASGEAWEDLKPGFEKAWTELKKSFEDAASRFK